MFIKKKNITGILSLLAFVLFSILSYVSVSQTLDGRLDFFSYRLNDYNFSNYQTGFVSPIYSVQKDGVVAHNKAIDYFHYNFMVGGCREVINEDIEIELSNGSTVKTAFVGQDVFSITNKVGEKDYIIERNMFHSYYKDEIIKTGVNYQARFGANTFIFISDKVADTIVKINHLEDFEDPYAEIIQNQQYALVSFVVDGGKIPITCSINNIVHSDIKQGARTEELYGDFILGFFDNHIAEHMTSRFEIDLKADPYGNKTCFKFFNSMDYTIDNSIFKFRLYDKEQCKYIENESLEQKYVNIWSSQNDFLFLSIGVVSGLVGLGILIFCMYNDRDKRFLDAMDFVSFFTRIGLFTIYGVIGCLVYIYSWGSIIPIVYAMTSLFEIKKIHRGLRNRKENKKLIHETDFAVIDI